MARVEQRHWRRWFWACRLCNLSNIEVFPDVDAISEKNWNLTISSHQSYCYTLHRHQKGLSMDGQLTSFDHEICFSAHLGISHPNTWIISFNDNNTSKGWIRARGKACFNRFNMLKQSIAHLRSINTKYSIFNWAESDSGFCTRVTHSIQSWISKSTLTNSRSSWPKFIRFCSY